MDPHASGGNGSYTYEWRYRFACGSGSWSGVVDTDSTYTRQMPNSDLELQVKVTSGSEIAYDTHCVELIINKAAQPLLTEGPVIPGDFSLSQNFPNPFNPETEIRFGLPINTPTQISIIDLLGREVRKLVDRDMKAGYHSVVWDGKDNEGNAVPSGIYVYQIIASASTGVAFRDWKKLALVR